VVNIGLVGAGYIGRLHAIVIHKNFSDAKVVKVFDAVERKGRQLADQVGASYCANLEGVMDDPGVNAVAICTPTYLHAEMVALAAQKGKDIFCEKPLALSVQEADGMIGVTEERGVKAFCGHVLRFWPVYVRARHVVQDGALGKPLFVYCERLLTMPTYTEKAWNQSEGRGGGVALDVQIHDLDFVAWLLGTPTEVNSVGLRDESRGGWVHIATQLKFESGSRALVQAGWRFPETFPFTMGFRIVCEKGVIEWSFRAGQLLEQRDSESPLVVYNERGEPRREVIDKTDAFLLEWRYFLDCLRNDKPVSESTFRDGKKALALALATMDSARDGRPVRPL
jgi:predicted dehydrogenase